MAVNRPTARRTLQLGLLLALCLGCDATLVSQITESQANRVIAALHEQTIAADKTRQGTQDDAFTVTVSKQDLGRALALVSRQGLPEEPQPGLAEIYADEGLVPSPSQDAAKLARALGGELSRTIEEMHGVTSARVHIAPSLHRNSREPAEPGRAAVLVRVHQDSQVTADQIRTLISGATPRVAAQSVEVLIEKAEDPPLAATPPALSRVGPFSVSAASAAPLRTMIAISLAFNMVTATVLGWILLRNRRGRGTV